MDKEALLVELKGKHDLVNCVDRKGQLKVVECIDKITSNSAEITRYEVYVHNHGETNEQAVILETFFDRLRRDLPKGKGIVQAIDNGTRCAVVKKYSIVDGGVKEGLFLAAEESGVITYTPIV